MCISRRVTVAFPEQHTTTSCVCGSPTTAAAAAALWFQYLFSANPCLVSTAGQLGTCLIFGENCEFAVLFGKTVHTLSAIAAFTQYTVLCIVNGCRAGMHVQRRKTAAKDAYKLTLRCLSTFDDSSPQVWHNTIGSSRHPVTAASSSVAESLRQSSGLGAELPIVTFLS